MSSSTCWEFIVNVTNVYQASWCKVRSNNSSRQYNRDENCVLENAPHCSTYVGITVSVYQKVLPRHSGRLEVRLLQQDRNTKTGGKVSRILSDWFGGTRFHVSLCLCPTRDLCPFSEPACVFSTSPFCGRHPHLTRSLATRFSL